jgi:hypothetical protein
MSNIHAFTLGAMVAYTPGLIFLALVLCRASPSYFEVPELKQPLPRLTHSERANGGRVSQRKSGRVIRSRRSTRPF